MSNSELLHIHSFKITRFDEDEPLTDIHGDGEECDPWAQDSTIDDGE